MNIPENINYLKRAAEISVPLTISNLLLTWYLLIKENKKQHNSQDFKID